MLACWAILGYFRICVGLCFGLGHFNVVEFSSIPGVCKKHQKYQEKIQFVDCVADGFCCYFSFVFVSILGHAVRLCLPDLGLMLGHSGLCRRHIIGSCWAILVYSVVFCHCWVRVGTILGLSCTIWGYVGPLWAMSAPYWIYWAHVEPFWCILWFVLAFVGQEFLAMLGHFGPRWHHIWLMLSHFSGILWFVVALVGQELGPYWAYLGPFLAMLGHFWQRRHRIALILSHFGPRWSKDARQTWQEVSQHSSSQRSKDTRRAWQSSRPQIETPIMVQVSQHSSKQTWQEVSRHSSRHSKDTNLQVQLSHDSKDPIWDTWDSSSQCSKDTHRTQLHSQRCSKDLFWDNRPNTAAGQPVQQGLAWESSQCSKRGQTQGQASQHSSIWRRTWDAHQACHHSSSNLHLTLYWPGFLSPCGFTNTWQYQ